MKEDEIYLLTKKLVLGQGFEILGGQPPNGTDRFPVIEIKSLEHEQKGSKSSYKPDLVVANSEMLMIIECKPSFDLGDVSKLREISLSDKRLRALINELRQRRSLERRNNPLALFRDSDLINTIRYCVAYSGEFHAIDDIYSIVFNRTSSMSACYLGRIEIDRF
jgi:hypothetical protein